MYSSSSLSKRLVLVPVLAIQLLISSVLSLNMTNAYLNHKCLVSEGKYKPGSVHEKYLKSIITSIASTSNNIGGYDMMSLGGGRDGTVSAILQCRGDSYGPKCRDCFATAVAGLRRKCPRYKGGIIWYDQCLLAISTIDSIGKVDYKNNFCMSNAKNESSDIYAYEVSWNTLMDNLTTIAVSVQNYSDPAALYAAGERRFKKEKLYGMVQCAKDISPKDCEECVIFNNMHFQDCLRSKRGARAVGRSCNFRFEFYPFVTKTGPKYLKN